MTRLKILRKFVANERLHALLQLLAEAGYLKEQVEVVDQVGEPETDGVDEVVVVVLTREACEPGVLDDDLAKALTGGRRAVCVWPSTEAQPVPDAVAKFSYSTVSWNADHLKAVLADDDATIFETPTGEPLPPPEPDHLECE